MAIKSREEHLEYLSTKTGKDLHQLILDKNSRRIKYLMDNIIVLADYSLPIFVSVIESELIALDDFLANKYFSSGDVLSIVTTLNGMSFPKENEVKNLLKANSKSSPIDKVQAIYDRHRILLDNMKDNRAREQDTMSDGELSLLDQMIVSLAGVLGDLYREVLNTTL